MGERWYPDLLAKIREKEAAMDAKTIGIKNDASERNGTNGVHTPSVPTAA